MGFDSAPRDLTRAEAAALMRGDLRDTLLSAFDVAETCMERGWDGTAPLAFQLVRSSDGQGANELAYPLVVEGLDDERPLRTLEIIATLLEGSPEQWPALVAGGTDARFLGISVLYPAGAGADGAHIPRHVKGVTDGGVGVLVSHTPGRPPTARVSIPTPHDDDPLDSDEVHVALRRVDAVFRNAYQIADAVRELHCDDEPLPLPDGCLTREELEAEPPSPLRDVALSAMEVEEAHHEAMGWSPSIPVAFRYRRHGEDRHLCPSALTLDDHPGDTAEGLDVIARMIATDDELRTDLSVMDGTYCGVSVLDHCLYLAARVSDDVEIPDGRNLADVPGSREMRYVLGVARGGSAFMVRRVRGQQPVVELASNLDAACVVFGGYGEEISANMRALRIINAEFTLLDVTPERVDPPTAALADLPPEKRFAGTDMVTLIIRWVVGQPREGQVYPALPGGHPYAGRPCPECERPLADGLPVQPFVVGPTDRAGRTAYETGRPHDAVAVLAHQRCIPMVGAWFANTLARVRSTPP